MEFGFWSVLAGIGGFYVGMRYVPDLPVLGKFTDASIGLAIILVGYGLKIAPVVAFGIGMTIEGGLRILGF
jgi:hypothetical protein